jgi:hypothetical protein
MTNHYARANLETKRLALAKVDTSTRPSKPFRWKRDPDLLAWLNRRGRLGGGLRRSPGVVPAIGNGVAPLTVQLGVCPYRPLWVICYVSTAFMRRPECLRSLQKFVRRVAGQGANCGHPGPLFDELG